jgi:hypothetical protein
MGTGELRNSRLVKPAPGIKLPAASVLAQDTKRCNITANEIWGESLASFLPGQVSAKRLHLSTLISPAPL